MKKILLLAIATMFLGTVSAQNEMAILNHNENISAFYGVMALGQALDSAVDGDIITLSSGSFQVNSISKAVTIKGNGFEEDLEAGTMPTTLSTVYTGYSGNNTIFISASVDLEGLKFNNEVRINYSIDAPRFSKCLFSSFLLGDNYSNTTNAVFVNCFFNISLQTSYQSEGTIVINSVINTLHSLGSLAQVKNCIIANVNQSSNSGTTFEGCVVKLYSNGNSRDQTNYYNCIGIGEQPYWSDAINYLQFQSLSQVQKDSVLANTNHSHNNYNASDFSDVFTSYTGQSYSERMDLSFTPAFDSLSVLQGSGIFRGMMPYTPFVNRPRFVRSNVAPRTTLDGKLSVDIQVITVAE